MFLLNMAYIPGTDFEVLGLVRGSAVIAKDAATDFMAGFANLVGGEISCYTDLLEEARQTATDRLEEEAEKLGADAVINIRYSTASVMAGAAEVLVYGTAVRYR